MTMDDTKRRDFSADAETWDENPGRVMNARAIADAILLQVPLSNEMDALDYGAGTGLVTLALSPSARSVVAADSAPGMLAKLDEKAAASGLDNVSTLALDLERDAVPALRVDLIVSTMTMHHITDVAKAVRSLCEMLRPSGFLAVADLDLDGGEFHADPTGVKHNGFDREEIQRIFERSGLTDITITTANTLNREVAGKGHRDFTVFLATGRKSREPAA